MDEQSQNPNVNAAPPTPGVPQVDITTMTIPQLRDLATSQYGLVLKGSASKASILEAIAEAQTGSTYTVLVRTLHDGDYYEVGEQIALSKRHADPLLKAKCIGVAI